MSDNGYLIWFVAMAAMIIAILTVGTLAAAGLIGREKSPTRRATAARASDGRGRHTTPANDATAAAAGERRGETESSDADRAYSNAGAQR
jgi:hypothetical protein